MSGPCCSYPVQTAAEYKDELRCIKLRRKLISARLPDDEHRATYRPHMLACKTAVIHLRFPEELERRSDRKVGDYFRRKVLRSSHHGSRSLGQLPDLMHSVPCRDRGMLADQVNRRKRANQNRSHCWLATIICSNPRR